ncbi:F0F1 ATP synthase subunit B [Roseococcus sp. SYP-B2431]|uniref:F0F1 ATP synthase subunit B family protein n=1 Tax=Roseococcus sp. SYP-B2431 TaxID=2496640 RepID=UPI00103E2A85|nr:F0F1 ATP synthase subunit B [Roseococcus sp. SYP-B2431]TCI00702.1 F0F1 ATP synthase subunit B [Roseococcus sp. SYP-B2431]
MPHHYEHFYLDPKFWVAISFVLFIALVGKLAWTKATAMLDARGARIRAELEEASRLRAEAEAMMAGARKEREQAVKDASAMLERAKTEAERVAAAARAEAEASARRRERMAMDRIAAAEASAVIEVRDAAAEIATAAVREIIAQKHDAASDAPLVDSAISGLPAAFKAA